MKTESQITYRRTAATCQGCTAITSHSSRKPDLAKNQAVKDWAEAHIAETGHEVMLFLVEDVLVTGQKEEK